MLLKIEVLHLEFLYLSVVDQDDFDGRIVVLRKSDQSNNLINIIVILDQIKLLN